MRREDVSLLTCLGDASPDLNDDVLGTAAVEAHLRLHPDLLIAWQTESAGTRGSPNHCVDGGEVGFYDAGFHDRLTYDDEVTACADFSYRKAAWVLQRRRVMQQGN